MSCASCSSGKGGQPAGCRNNGHCATGGCNKLPVYDWLTGIPLPGQRAAFAAVEVQFKNTRKGFYRLPGDVAVLPGDLVTVEGGPGHDVGTITLTGELVRAQMERKLGHADTHELRAVLRRSSQADIDTWHGVRQLEDPLLFATRRIGQELRLDMKVSDIEYQGDGTRATVYYVTEQRIDVRELIQRLAPETKARLDFKQIGARQEAARIGGIGSCGRELCCSTWLTDLRSVTTSAARYQQLSLNQQKLAGQCGKLKCCLNYELDMYVEAIKSYPSQNAKLRTQQGVGYHMKTDIFEDMMWYLFKKPGYGSAVAGFPVEKVREILAQNKEGVEPEVDLHMAAEIRAEKVAKTEVEVPEYESVGGEEDLTRFDSKIKGSSGKRGRGGRDRKKGVAPKGDGPKPARPAGERSAKPEGQAKSASKERDGNRRRGGRNRGGQQRNAPQAPPAP